MSTAALSLIARDPRAGGQHRIVLVALASLADDTGTATTTALALAETTGRPARRIPPALLALKARGDITCDWVPDDPGQAFTVHLDAATGADLRVREFPAAVTP